MQQAKPLNIFKPGRHTAMSGAALSFSESDLQATVAAYNPTLHEAPLVVGHPKHDLPAYGWVKSLSFGEGGIEATPAQVDPAFAELVGRGAYKKISACFYAPTAPNNPVPGVYYLRHVGFLGAQPPAVKGLRSPAFGEDEEGVVEFSEWDDVTNAGLWRGLREWLLEKFGADTADRVVPAYQVGDLESSAQQELAAARTETSDVSPAQFSQPEESTVTEAEAAQLREQNAALAASNAALQAAAAAHARAAVNTANVDFAEKLVSEARLLPAAQAVVVATLNHLAAQDTPVQFGEGDAAQPLADALKGVLGALPAQVKFGESATRDRAVGGVAGAEDAAFADSDPERLAQHKQVLAYADANKVDYATAAQAIVK